MLITLGARRCRILPNSLTVGGIVATFLFPAGTIFTLCQACSEGFYAQFFVAFELVWSLLYLVCTVYSVYLAIEIWPTNGCYVAICQDGKPPKVLGSSVLRNRWQGGLDSLSTAWALLFAVPLFMIITVAVRALDIKRARHFEQRRLEREIQMGQIELENDDPAAVVPPPQPAQIHPAPPDPDPTPPPPDELPPPPRPYATTYNPPVGAYGFDDFEVQGVNVAVAVEEEDGGEDGTRSTVV